MLHKITLNNKENDGKTYYFNQKKFYFIFTLRIYIGHCYKYKQSLNFIKKGEKKRKEKKREEEEEEYEEEATR